MTKNINFVLISLIVVLRLKLEGVRLLFILWVLLIIINAFSFYARFIRILLTLEILVMIIILVVPFQGLNSHLRRGIFYLIIIFSVIEAVVGLSLLVRLRVVNKNIVASLSI